jgi:hypothetical protein
MASFSIMNVPLVIDRKGCLFERSLIDTTGLIFRRLIKTRGLMDPKLVKQFVIFLVILFGWTIVALLMGYK